MDMNMLYVLKKGQNLEDANPFSPMSFMIIEKEFLPKKEDSNPGALWVPSKHLNAKILLKVKGVYGKENPLYVCEIPEIYDKILNNDETSFKVVGENCLDFSQRVYYDGIFLPVNTSGLSKRLSDLFGEDWKAVPSAYVYKGFRLSITLFKNRKILVDEEKEQLTLYTL